MYKIINRNRCLEGVFDSVWKSDFHTNIQTYTNTNIKIQTYKYKHTHTNIHTHIQTYNDTHICREKEPSVALDEKCTKS